MIEARVHSVEAGRIVRYQITESARLLTYSEVVQRWGADPEFQQFFSRLFRESSCDAFRWELPGLTVSTMAEPFECVLINAPELHARPADSSVFADYFKNGEQFGAVTSFRNLGGDALMIVPVPPLARSAFGHFAQFLRNAPDGQTEALWKVIGESVASAIGETPLWLNTAGDGVAWLHVRLDSQPKYYRFAPYKRAL